jgi:hypothetical protein
VTLRVKGLNRHHVLSITRLYDEIEDAAYAYRKRKDRVILTLQKKGTNSWFELRKSS